MLLHILADHLRNRQKQLGIFTEAMIAELSDKDIIYSYITCINCQSIEVDLKHLKKIVKSSNTVDDFFHRCHEFKHSHVIQI